MTFARSWWRRWADARGRRAPERDRDDDSVDAWERAPSPGRGRSVAVFVAIGAAHVGVLAVGALRYREPPPDRRAVEVISFQAAISPEGGTIELRGSGGRRIAYVRP